MATSAHERTESQPGSDPTRHEPPTRRPGGLPRVVVVLLGIAAAWFGIMALQGLHEIIAPVFFALNLMIVVYPIKHWLSQRHVPAWVGSVLCGLIGFVLIIGFFAALGWSLAVAVQELPKYKTEFTDLYHQSLQLLTRFGVSEAQVTEAFKSFDPSSMFSYLGKVLSGVSGGLSLLTVILTTMVFLIMDSMDFEERLPIVAKYHPNLVGALQTFAQGTRKYWVVATVFGAIVALLDLVVLLLCKVPLALPWTVLSFLTNYIPSVGFVLGIVPPALMGLLARGPVVGLIVVVAYCVINFVAQSIIQPKVAGDAVGVTPTVTFLSLLFWAWVLGPMGAILALPATLFVKAIFIDADPDARWLNAFVSAKPQSAEKDENVHDAADPQQTPDPELKPHPGERRLAPDHE